ncbi:hypothetical protein NC653_007463 [Populus alba x Populus x berolinensis]|uniref:Uncharacterized protein n=1 Tax=Populus alba x Populus x berolinensis TaxID=444605 RepID=A0AAD6RHG9_9ROSI|nr:hypothetical protein NC653_007463 [Populus alba x Populus x berolinensis]
MLLPSQSMIGCSGLLKRSLVMLLVKNIPNFQW